MVYTVCRLIREVIMQAQHRDRPIKTFTLSPKTIDRLDKIAAVWGVSRSGVIDTLVFQEAERMGLLAREQVEA